MHSGSADVQYFMHFIWPGAVYVVTVLGGLLAAWSVAHILRTSRMPAATMGWLCVIIFVPVIGIPLYFTFGVRKLTSKINLKTKMDLPDRPNFHLHPVNSLLVSLGIPSSSEGNNVNFHKDGKSAYIELIALLNNARSSIDIAIFILGDDPVGHEILSLLERKAAMGIKLRLLLDGVGSFMMPKHKLKPLIKKGGRVAWFIPVLHRPLRGSTNLRNHRKIIIVDREKVWTGGRNLASEYIGPACPDSCWIDISFCQKGPAVSTYLTIFEADWDFAINSHDKHKAGNQNAENLPRPQSCGNSCIQVVPSGPDIADDPIYAALLTACYGSKKRISIVTPYYVPNIGMQEALRLAALRGVFINMILPEKSNHRIADISRNRFLRELADAGAHIRLIPDTMVHAKIFIIDDTLAMAGSANLDTRSLFLNLEVMSCFYSEHDIQWLTNWFDRLNETAIHHHPEPAGLLKEMLEGLVLLTGYQL